MHYTCIRIRYEQFVKCIRSFYLLEWHAYSTRDQLSCVHRLSGRPFFVRTKFHCIKISLFLRAENQKSFASYSMFDVVHGFNAPKIFIGKILYHRNARMNFLFVDYGTY